MGCRPSLTIVSLLAFVAILSNLAGANGFGLRKTTGGGLSLVGLNSACKNVDYKSLCVATIKHFMKSRGALTPTGVLRSTIQSTIAQTTSAKAMASNLMKGQDKTGKDILQVCVDNYDQVISDLHTAIKYLTSGTKGDLMTYLSSIMSGYETCSDAFLEASRISPLLKTNAALKNLGSNCLALGTSLKKH